MDIEHLRAGASQDVLDVMNEVEIDESGWLWKQKRAYEKSIRDPDDVYFEVREREEECRQQRLPSLIGILRRHFTREEARAMDRDAEPEETPELPCKPKISRRKTKH